MSSKLKKKSKDRISIEKRLIVRNKKEIIALRKQEKKEDDAIMAVSRSMCCMTYLSLLDVLGFKEKRLRKFYSLVNAMKIKWSQNKITTAEMQNYCIKKKIQYQEWLRSIPSTQKVSLCPMVITSVEGMKCVDAAILANGMFTAIVLKEHFRIPLKKIHEVLEKIKFMIGCYATKQPGSKKTYLSDEDIMQIFREELKLDLETGNKIA